MQNDIVPIVNFSVSADYPLITEYNQRWVVPLKATKNQATDKYEPNYMINCQELAKHIKDNIPYLFVKENARGNKLMYIYSDGYYKMANENEFKGLIKGFIPYSLVKSKDINEIYFDLSTEHIHIDSERLNVEEKYINFNNGLLNVKTFKLEPHSHLVYSTIRIPMDYVPLSECTKGETFEYYIDHLTNGNDKVKNLLLEVCGLVMSNIYGYRTKKAVFMIGKHNSGKTQLKELLTEIIGRDNVCTTDLERLNAQFGTSDIYQKRMGGSNDLGYQPVKEMVIFKQLTGGDSITVEFKGLGGFPYKFRGFLWFNSNTYPKFSGDKDKAMYERILPIICDNVVEIEKRDSELLEKMLKEKQYIVALCLENLKNLIARKYKFDEPEEVITARDNYETENNNLFMFVSTSCLVIQDLDSSARMKIKTFKRHYQTWCENNGYSYRITDKDLKMYLEQKYKTVPVKSNGYWYFNNLKMTEDFLNEYGSFSHND